MELKRREQAKDRPRNLDGDCCKAFMFGAGFVRQPVQPSAHAFELAARGEARQDDARDAEGMQIA